MDVYSDHTCVTRSNTDRVSSVSDSGWADVFDYYDLRLRSDRRVPPVVRVGPGDSSRKDHRGLQTEDGEDQRWETVAEIRTNIPLWLRHTRGCRPTSTVCASETVVTTHRYDRNHRVRTAE